MRALITLPVLFVFTALGFADTINVPADQPSIQAGINAAVNGDTVLVAPGTYVEIIDFLGKAITVKSSHGAETTVIDGDEDYSVVSFYSLEGPDSVLEGFTITNGYPVIGGIYSENSSPTITGNTITGNWANFGGGIWCAESNLNITNNTITRNSVVYEGGGIYSAYSSSPLLANTILWDNSAQIGPEIRIGSTSDPSTLTISYSDVKGGQASVFIEPGSTLNWGPGMIDTDPLFADSV